MNHIWNALSASGTAGVLSAMLVGVVGGMVIGILPGLGGTIAAALLLPLTYTLSPTAALVMLTSIYTSAVYCQIHAPYGSLCKDHGSITAQRPALQHLWTVSGNHARGGRRRACWVAYDSAKRAGRHPEVFGWGSIAGICASESSNNAVTGGSFIRLFTLGVPGNSTAAVILGGMMNFDGYCRDSDRTGPDKACECPNQQPGACAFSAVYHLEPIPLTTAYMMYTCPWLLAFWDI